MSENPRKPWHGVVVATALPFRADLTVDFDAFAAHVRYLIAAGCDGVCVNGSLGEYQVLTEAERAEAVRVAVDAAGGGRVVAGVSAYGSREVCRWIDQAIAAGAGAALLLPPNAYRADERAVVEHYTEAAKPGLPIVAYNNPIDTKVDLTPELLARIHAEAGVSAVKEFSGDVRRAYRIAELAPGLELLAGADDVLLELGVAGITGWIAGYPNALPAACAALYRAVTRLDLGAALPLYRALHPLLRWDSRTEFVQAIKLSMDVAGHYGGPCRPPRSPLDLEQEQAIRLATERVLDLERNAAQAKAVLAPGADAGSAAREL